MEFALHCYSCKSICNKILGNILPCKRREEMRGKPKNKRRRTFISIISRYTVVQRRDRGKKQRGRKRTNSINGNQIWKSSSDSSVIGFRENDDLLPNFSFIVDFSLSIFSFLLSCKLTTIFNQYRRFSERSLLSFPKRFEICLKRNRNTECRFIF